MVLIDQNNIKRCTMLCPLTTLYGQKEGKDLYDWLQNRIASFKNELHTTNLNEISEKDAILITYADQFNKIDELPLQTLYKFGKEYLEGVVSGLHILPFFPWSSDDGFSIIDYREVDPLLGTWQDINRLGNNFQLMIDAVINHISSKSDWVNKFLDGDPKYKDFFISRAPAEDLSMVFRPRTSPLLTQFNTKDGPKWVWTTFSADQIDLNYKNPQVFKEIVDILLLYVHNGASIIRLDAIAYLWKEIGTKCIHLPQTHAIVHLFNRILDQVAPNVKLITETNVPHEENISYFGDGYTEAHLVYNFTLPPLILHTLYSENANNLTQWASQLTLPTDQVTFFNFLASHDGIGVTPVKGILTDNDIEQLETEVIKRDGLISYKKNQDNSESPYELNISYLDALSLTNEKYGSKNHIARFILAHAIMMSMVGLPGLYIHSLLGTKSWHEGVERTGQKRTINRKKFDYEKIKEELTDEDSITKRVYHGMSVLLQTRAKSSAFHPHGAQLIIDLGKSIFALLRISQSGNDIVLCLHNISSSSVEVNIDPQAAGLAGNNWRDLFSEKVIDLNTNLEFTMDAYQVAWFKKD